MAAARELRFHTLLVATVLTLTLASGSLPGDGDAAGPRCTRFLSAGGNLQAFAARLAPGERGCLRPGSYDIPTTFAIRNSGRPGRRITLTSANPNRPPLIRGRFWVADTANYWTFSHLRFDGRNHAFLPSPAVNGDFTIWRYVDVTNHRSAPPSGQEAGGICFALGSTGSYGYATGTIIERSRIHDCGVANNHNHGIYAVATRGRTIIRDNFIYRNGDRGVQLYPDADDVVIEHNVLDGNGTGVIISSKDGHTSDRALVRRNVISNSHARFNVETYFPLGVPAGSESIVTSNCVWASNGAKDGWFMRDGGIGPRVGFVAARNRIARPVFVSRAQGDYRHRRASPCRGYGPRYIVP